MHSEKIFYRILLPGLLLCLALYAEEAVHFLHYGLISPDNDAWTRDISSCKPVTGNITEIECPVRGYGMARYRYKFHIDPGHHIRNSIFFVDRIEYPSPSAGTSGLSERR